MERQNLMGPYDLHLQWFAEGAAAAAGEAGAGGEEGKPKEGATGAEGKPPEKPTEKPPEPELKAEGWTAQLPDKYKKDSKFLKDLSQHKTMGEAIDRLYAAESKLTELQAKLAPAPAKLEEYEFDELKFPDYLAGDEHKGLREYLQPYMKAQDDTVRAAALKAGLSKEVAKLASGIVRDATFAQQKASQDDQAKQRETGLTALKAEWKGDFAAREDVARRAILTFGKEKLVTALAKRGLENEPSILEFCYNIGNAIGEGQLVPGKAGPVAPTKEQQQTAAMKQRYNRSPELTGEPAAPGAGIDQAALDRLAKRYPQQAAAKKP